MARSQLDQVKQDLLSDPGSVLFSIVRGEQLSYPLDLNGFTTLVGYTFEAVVVEADNVADQTDPPKLHKSGGVQTTLTVVIPTNQGNWNAPTAYNENDTVFYNSKYYRLIRGTAYVNATPPDADPSWEESAVNRIFIRFPMTLGGTWAVQPNVQSNVYGFFELRVTETSGAFPSTWKPVRGMIEILFSPTELVP
jgi:hypothetical protein